MNSIMRQVLLAKLKPGQHLLEETPDGGYHCPQCQAEREQAAAENNEMMGAFRHALDDYRPKHDTP